MALTFPMSAPKYATIPFMPVDPDSTTPTTTLVTNFENTRRPFIDAVLALYGRPDLEIRPGAFDKAGAPIAGSSSVHQLAGADVPAFWRAFRQLRAGR